MPFLRKGGARIGGAGRDGTVTVVKLDVMPKDQAGLQKLRQQLEEERSKLDAGWGALSDGWAELAEMQKELEGIAGELGDRNFSPALLKEVTKKLAASSEKVVSIRCRRRITFENGKEG